MKICQFVAFATFLLMTAESGFCTGGGDKIGHPAKDTYNEDAVQSLIPAYIEYTSFEWETYRAVPRQEVADSLHKAIRIGLDKAQATNTRISIVRVTSPGDIQELRTLLKGHQDVPHMRVFADTRLLFDADRGETQIFVDQGGLVSQGTRLWQLSPQDFARLKQVLNRIYATVPGQR